MKPPHRAILSAWYTFGEDKSYSKVISMILPFSCFLKGIIWEDLLLAQGYLGLSVRCSGRGIWEGLLLLRGGGLFWSVELLLGGGKLFRSIWLLPARSAPAFQ